MKIVFISNFLNHHQLPLCLELKKVSNSFVFGACTPVPEERLSMGYYDMNKQYDFVLCAYESEEKKKELLSLAEECDILIVGGLNITLADQFVRLRKAKNKITFQYLERIYKEGVWHVLSPRGTRNMRKYHASYRKNHVYALCASAYTAWDLGLTGSYVNKTYKWGYFPKVNQYDIDALMQEKKKNKKVSILWVARLIPLKHPEDAVEVANRLKKSGYDFELNIIGNGVMEQEIKELISSKNLEDCVHMLGAMSPEDVRAHMDKADIFLFTSDFNEGWGAVMNESMNSGCAVVANYAIGSVPFLIDHGRNGFVYKHGNFDTLYDAVVKLIEDPELRENMGRAAYETMIKEWSPEAAAVRLLKLSEQLQKDGKCDEFSSGPCSVAERVGNGKMYKKITQKG